MAKKRHFTSPFNFQSTSPIPFVPNTPLTNVVLGAMTSTSTIYSNIIDITNEDNVGLEITYTGNAAGSVSILCSDSGINFYPPTLTTAITQPSGSTGGCLINLNQLPYNYILIKYTNATGSGLLSVYLTAKDLN